MYLILGFTNRTSYALVNYLVQYHSVELVIADQTNTLEQQELISSLSDNSLIINELGNQTESLLLLYNIEKIFLSPGVPRKLPIIQQAELLNIEILNDIEFFYQLFPHRKYIGITGTDGKTTVTSWLEDVIARQQPVVLAGNIGIPIFEFFDSQYENHIFVVELSSFQLESVSTFHPVIATILNVHEDHTDRYTDIIDYLSKKQNIFANQTDADCAILNKDCLFYENINQNLSSNIIEVSLTQQGEFHLKGDIIYQQERPFFDSRLLQLVGKHNIYNAMMVSAIAMNLGIEEGHIINSLKEFQGIPHRLQYVGCKKGIRFYNDSKATTAFSVSVAVQSFKDPVILLAGGRSKAIDFASIKEIVQSHTKEIFLFGEIAHYLFSVWNKGKIVQSMEEAVYKAIHYAQEGDTILLSPGGTSFDEYQSFSERGDHFINLIQQDLQQW